MARRDHRYHDTPSKHGLSARQMAYWRQARPHHYRQRPMRWRGKSAKVFSLSISRTCASILKRHPVDGRVICGTQNSTGCGWCATNSREPDRVATMISVKSLRLVESDHECQGVQESTSRRGRQWQKPTHPRRAEFINVQTLKQVQHGEISDVVVRQQKFVRVPH